MPIFTSHIVSYGRGLLGVPWRHRGRSPSGVDCLGLILLSYFHAGWVPRHGEAVARLDYNRLSSTDDLLDVLDGEGKRLPIGDKNEVAHVLAPADVLVFRFASHTWPQHVALVSEVRDGCALMLHARATGSKKTSLVVEHSLADGWLQALDTAYRLEGVILDG